MENQEIESLAVDLANDAKDSGLKCIIIYSEGNAQSISRVDFDYLRKRLSALLPDLSVVYQLSK